MVTIHLQMSSVRAPHYEASWGRAWALDHSFMETWPSRGGAWERKPDLHIMKTFQPSIVLQTLPNENQFFLPTTGPASYSPHSCLRKSPKPPKELVLPHHPPHSPLPAPATPWDSFPASALTEACVQTEISGVTLNCMLKRKKIQISLPFPLNSSVFTTQKREAWKSSARKWKFTFPSLFWVSHCADLSGYSSWGHSDAADVLGPEQHSEVGTVTSLSSVRDKGLSLWDSWRICWLPLDVRFPTYWTVICLFDCLGLSTLTSSTLWQESGCLAFPLSQGNYKLKQNFKLCAKHNFSRIQKRSTCEVIFYKGVPAGLTLSPRLAFLGPFSHLSYQGVPSSQLPVQISTFRKPLHTWKDSWIHPFSCQKFIPKCDSLCACKPWRLGGLAAMAINVPDWQSVQEGRALVPSHRKVQEGRDPLSWSFCPMWVVGMSSALLIVASG